MFLFSVVCCSSAIIETPVSAEKGVIDFTASGMQQNIRYSLNGEWEFYWNRLLTPEDFTAMSSNRDINYIAVPSIWNGYRPDIDAEGYATYRLTLILPTTNEDYAFKISTIATAYRFYLNGVLIASNGVVGTNVQSTYAQSLPRLFYFFGAKMTNEIIIQAANFIHPKGGIWESISVGYFRSMVQINDFERLFEAFVVGILIFIAVYHLILFLYRRKERIFLFICLLCVLMAIRISLTGEYLSAYVNPQFDWELGRRILIASFYLGVIVLMGVFPEPLQADCPQSPAFGYADRLFCTDDADTASAYTHILCAPVFRLDILCYSVFPAFILFDSQRFSPRRKFHCIPAANSANNCHHRP